MLPSAAALNELSQFDRLIDALLGLSRITRTTINHRKVDLGGMAREAALALQQEAPEREVTFDIEPGRLPGKRRRVDQLV